MSPYSSISSLIRLDREKVASLKKLGLVSVKDLLFYFPTRYADIAEGVSVSHTDLDSKTEISLIGRFQKLEATKSWKTKIAMTKGIFIDTEGTRVAVTFMRQPYIAKMYEGVSSIKLIGILKQDEAGKFSMMNPKVEQIKELVIDHSDSLFSKNADGSANTLEDSFTPLYPTTKGITSNWFHVVMKRALSLGIHNNIPDPLPSELLKKLSLPPLATALVWLHDPKNKNHAEAARKRFAFQEIFLIQLARQKLRAELEKTGSTAIPVTEDHLLNFWKHLGFTPTGAQKNAIHTVVRDISKTSPMLRLLEGDVGSGKTAVAAGVCYAIAETSLEHRTQYQVAYLAPTEVLATQLFESFISFFKHQPLPIALMTGKTCRKFPSKTSKDDWTNVSKAQLNKWLVAGDISIIIGTHALLSEKVKFKNLALAIIDEQHRFGTNQRAKITRKHELTPHLLSMTATPIPRTLALTIYGDLDLSVLDELPAGRKVPQTHVKTFEEMEKVWEHLKNELQSGRQAYIICARIAENEESSLDVISTESAQKLVKKFLPEFSVGVMHSKLTKDKKEEVMQEFNEHKFDILISTSVVEVGVNVPNATNIVIFNSDRFGLAQLHQLRGRVQRGSFQSHCFLVTKSQSENSMKRLGAMAQTSDGFKLAEADLANRGTGDLAGIKQWGLSDIAMEALRNPKLVEITREEARKLIAEDPDFNNYPIIKETLESGEYKVHLE